MKGQQTSDGTARGVLRLISRIEDGILVTLLTGLILVAATQIFLRNVFDMGLAWGDPLLRVLVLWVALMGAVAASRDDKHININVLLRFMAGRSQAIAQIIISLFTTMISAIVAYHAARFVYLDYEAGTKAFSSVPVWIVDLILPIGFGLISLSYLLSSLANFKKLFTVEGGS